MKNWYVLIIAMASIAAACGKATVDSENSRWQSNQKRLDRVAALYKTFKPIIKQLHTDAEKQFKAAESIGKEEDKIAAMAAANDAASPLFVRELDGLADKIKTIKDKMVDVQQLATDKSDQNAAWTASQAAQATLTAADSKLRDAAPSTVSEADALVKSIVAELNSAEDRLDKVANAAEAKAKEAQQAEEDKKKAADDAKKAVADIKCEYCGKLCAHDAKECPHCGAPLSKKSK